MSCSFCSVLIFRLYSRLFVLWSIYLHLFCSSDSGYRHCVTAAPVSTSLFSPDLVSSLVCQLVMLLSWILFDLFLHSVRSLDSWTKSVRVCLVLWNIHLSGVTGSNLVLTLEVEAFQSLSHLSLHPFLHLVQLNAFCSFALCKHLCTCSKLHKNKLLLFHLHFLQKQQQCHSNTWIREQLASCGRRVER